MRFCEPTPAEVKRYRKWVKALPEKPRAVAERLDMWTLYRMRSTGDRVTLYSFADDGTVTVNISGEFNKLLFERRVFGIDPEDLVECDLPAAGEELGAAMTGEDVADNIDTLRVMIRPDLWTMGADGKAVRKH